MFFQDVACLSETERQKKRSDDCIKLKKTRFNCEIPVSESDVKSRSVQDLPDNFEKVFESAGQVPHHFFWANLDKDCPLPRPE